MGKIKINSEATVFSAWTTAWGAMGAAADPDGICKIILPHYRMKDLVELLSWEHPSAKRDDKAFSMLIELSRDYFNGKPVEFDEIPCLLPSEKTFAGKILRACRKVRYAQTMSYLSLSQEIGRDDAARPAAAALGKNPVPLVVPCHRIIYSGGKFGGFSADGGIQLKKRMLEMEKNSTNAS